MGKTIYRVTAIAILALVIASASFAQGQGSGQFQQFREQHKYTFQLMQMVHHIGAINENPKYALTSAQAKQVLAVLKPLCTKSKLTQEQAKNALKSLKRVFTVTQLNAMAKVKPPVRRMGNGGPGAGGPGGPGGQGAPGNRPRWEPSAMKDFNPLCTKADKSDKMAAGRKKRITDLLSSLEKKVKQTKPASVRSTKTPVKSRE